MTFDPTSVEVICVTLPKDHCVQVPWKYIKVCGYSDLFLQKTWTKGHWPLDGLWPHISWGHMCDSTQGSLCPSPMKIHQSMWIQWPFLQKLEPKIIDPSMTFDPKSVEVTCVTLPKDHCVQVPWKYIEVCGYSDPFCKNLNQRSLTPRWPLTPHLLRSHVWLYPRIVVSKSHGNTSMCLDTVINFTNYHIHTRSLTHRPTTYYIQNEWSHSLFLNYVQARQKSKKIKVVCAQLHINFYTLSKNVVCTILALL